MDAWLAFADVWIFRTRSAASAAVTVIPKVAASVTTLLKVFSFIGFLPLFHFHIQQMAKIILI